MGRERKVVHSADVLVSLAGWGRIKGLLGIKSLWKEAQDFRFPYPLHLGHWRSGVRRDPQICGARNPDGSGCLFTLPSLLSKKVP